MQRTFLAHAGYTEQAPTSQDERTNLLHLLGLCLAGDGELHLRLVHALEGLSQQPLPQSLLPIVNPPVMPPTGAARANTRSVPATAAAAIAGLKLQVRLPFTSPSCPFDEGAVWGGGGGGGGGVWVLMDWH